MLLSIQPTELRSSACLWASALDLRSIGASAGMVDNTGDYSKLKVTELRQKLEERGLAKAGLKSALVERLIQDDHAKSSQVEDATVEPLQNEPSSPAETPKDDLKTVNSATSATDVSRERAQQPVNEAEDESSQKEATSLEAQDSSKNEQIASPIVGEGTTENTSQDSVRVGQKRDDPYTGDIRDEKGGSQLLPADNLEIGQEIVANRPKRQKLSPSRDSQEATQIEKENSAPKPGSNLQNNNSVPSAGATDINSAKNEMPSVEKNITNLEKSTSHTTTCSIFVKGFTRPLVVPQLKRYIEAIGGPVSHFHMDQIKTHAMIQFNDCASAEKALNSLQGSTYPENEKGRNLLSADYIPDDRIRAWSDLENESGLKSKFTVKYDEKGSADFVDLNDAGPKVDASRGPIGSRLSSNDGAVGAHTQPPAKPKMLRLDELFQKTKTTPHLYYLPVPMEVAQRRLRM